MGVGDRNMGEQKTGSHENRKQEHGGAGHMNMVGDNGIWEQQTETQGSRTQEYGEGT